MKRTGRDTGENTEERDGEGGAARDRDTGGREVERQEEQRMTQEGEARAWRRIRGFGLE